MMQRCKVYFDGGCRPNPGPIEAAVVIRGKVHLLDGLGSGSSQDAEWLALIGAARLVRELGLGSCALVGDSRKVIAAAERPSIDEVEDKTISGGSQRTPANDRPQKEAA